MSYTLRDLPLPVKVVATVFLMAVGVGYTSAMLQLHIKDAKPGGTLPTFADVILKFTGKKRADRNAPPPRPVSRLEAIITGDAAPLSANSMTAAFTTEDRAKGTLKYSTAVRDRLAEEIERVKAERKGEQEVFALWINAPDAERKAAYGADKFTPPAGTMPKAFTPLLTDGNAVKIRTLIDARCATCHSRGGDKEEVPLDTYDALAKHMEVPPAAPVGDWVQVQPPMELGKLTQSTHAHLLSFATLFSLTGLIFALSSWPVRMRVVFGPWVVIAVFADVSCWWMARLCNEWGPYFAMAVVGTGFLAGVGLFVQIAGSLFTMYGLKGRAVIGLLFLFGALAGGAFVMKLLVPALPKPKAEQKPDEKQPPAPKQEPYKPVHAIDKLLIWPPVDEHGQPIPLPADPKQFQFKGEGTMVHAFFDKDKDYKKFLESNKPQGEKDKMKAQRQGDLDAMLAWARSPEAARKAAYETDKFELPGLSDKTLTPEFVKDSKVRIKTLIDNRCVTCHGPDGKQFEYPLDTYKGFSEYLKPYDAPSPK